jgi:hypothetical protein
MLKWSKAEYVHKCLKKISTTDFQKICRLPPPVRTSDFQCDAKTISSCLPPAPDSSEDNSPPNVSSLLPTVQIPTSVQEKLDARNHLKTIIQSGSIGSGKMKLFIVSDSSLKFGKQTKSSSKVANLIAPWLPSEYEDITVKVICTATAKDLLQQLKEWVTQVTGSEDKPE